MIKPSIFIHYTFQMIIINLHSFPNTRHVYMILIGLLISLVVSRLPIKLRYLIGNISIFLYIQYPFLYFLSYGYILSNTYRSTSLLLHSVDITKNVYLTELLSSIISYIIHIDYSIIYVLSFIDLVLIYYLKIQPCKEDNIEMALKKINELISDYNLRKNEYKCMISKFNFFNVYKERAYCKSKEYNEVSCDIHDTSEEKERSVTLDIHERIINHNEEEITRKRKEVEVVLDEKYNLVRTEIYKKKECVGYIRNLSVDLITPLIFLNKDIYGLLLLITSMIQTFNIKYLDFLVVFLYMNEYYIVSLLVNIVSGIHNTKNISSRLVSIVVLYYLYNL